MQTVEKMLVDPHRLPSGLRHYFKARSPPQPGSLWTDFHAWYRMAKVKVTFRIVRQAEDDWKILAEYPAVPVREITGLKSKADAQDWVNGDRRIAWLRSQGYAK
jgi:hypothetical protein